MKVSVGRDLIVVVVPLGFRGLLIRLQVDLGVLVWLLRS